MGMYVHEGHGSNWNDWHLENMYIREKNMAPTIGEHMHILSEINHEAIGLVPAREPAGCIVEVFLTLLPGSARPGQAARALVNKDIFDQELIDVAEATDIAGSP